jgi:hypothetical protein
VALVRRLVFEKLSPAQVSGLASLNELVLGQLDDTGRSPSA